MNTTLKNKYDSIIFDLDGTLWDSSANVVLAWQAAKEQVDYIKEDFTQPMIHSITGMTYKAIFETLLPYLNEEQREEFKTIAGKNELEILYEKGGELYPGLEDALKYLSTKYKLFIVSNCQSGYIEVFFKISGLEHYYKAATKAGVPFIFADYGFGVVQEDQVATISGLVDLVDIL
jgi:phosphoglycolate phosphatase